MEFPVSTTGATALPRFIALCGHPKAGKSTVQTILAQEFGYDPVDDGLALRRIGMQHLGLTHDQVFTQAGKAEYVEILGQRWQVREILGELGKKLEDLFGPHIMPFMATRNLPADGRFSFGSVRKSQGAFFKALGGVVIEVRNPIAPPSPYAFDKFDASLVDQVIDNDAQARGLELEAGLMDLRAKVIRAVGAAVEPV